TTSELLANQADELQASIAYFRVRDEAAARQAVAPAAAPRRRAEAPAAKPADSIARKIAHRSKPASSGKLNAIAGRVARSNGFALDLNQGGPDAEDADFGSTAA
ncbi:HAMP domain protein, partial [Novosphingobium sp. Rr 2-17]